MFTDAYTLQGEPKYSKCLFDVYDVKDGKMFAIKIYDTTAFSFHFQCSKI